MSAFPLFQESSEPQVTPVNPHLGAVVEVPPMADAVPVVALGQPPSDEEMQVAASALLSARQWGLRNDAQGIKLIHALIQLSEIRHRQGDAIRAESLLNEALHRFQEFTSPDAVVGHALFTAMGLFCERRGRSAEALEFYQQALPHAGRLKQTTKAAELYQLVADCCRRLGDFVHADEYQALAGARGAMVPPMESSRETVAQPVATPAVSAPRNGPETVVLPNRLGLESRWMITRHTPETEQVEILTAEI